MVGDERRDSSSLGGGSGGDRRCAAPAQSETVQEQNKGNLGGSLLVHTAFLFIVRLKRETDVVWQEELTSLSPAWN